jgi:Cysteine-rich CPXCG
MKRPIPDNQRPKPDLSLRDAQSIDAQYGLEPVIEFSASADAGDASSGAHFHLVQCPYCGESFETQLDTSSGSARYIEDCQVCCRPIEFDLEVDHAGALVALSAVCSD